MKTKQEITDNLDDINILLLYIYLEVFRSQSFYGKEFTEYIFNLLNSFSFSISTLKTFIENNKE